MSIVLGRPNALRPAAVSTGGARPEEREAPLGGDEHSGPPNLRPMALLGLAAMTSVVVGAVVGGPAFSGNAGSGGKAKCPRTGCCSGAKPTS